MFKADKRNSMEDFLEKGRCQTSADDEILFNFDTRDRQSNEYEGSKYDDITDSVLTNFDTNQPCQRRKRSRELSIELVSPSRQDSGISVEIPPTPEEQRRRFRREFQTQSRTTIEIPPTPEKPRSRYRKELQTQSEEIYLLRSEIKKMTEDKEKETNRLKEEI